MLPVGKDVFGGEEEFAFVADVAAWREVFGEPDECGGGIGLRAERRGKGGGLGDGGRS
jgi:hypothetical protein